MRPCSFRFGKGIGRFGNALLPWCKALAVHFEHRRDQIQFGTAFVIELCNGAFEFAHLVVHLFVLLEILGAMRCQDTLHTCGMPVGSGEGCGACLRTACLLGLWRDGGHVRHACWVWGGMGGIMPKPKYMLNRNILNILF